MVIQKRTKTEKVIERLIESLDIALTKIADIRYRNWDSNAESFGLNAEELDVILRDGDKALNYAKKNKKNILKNEMNDELVSLCKQILINQGA